MEEADQELQAKTKVLEKDITDLKSDIHTLEKILLEANVADSEEEDKKELKNIEQEIEEL